MIALLRLTLIAVGEALGMRFTGRSAWVAVISSGTVAAAFVFIAVSTDGRVTGLEWAFVGLATVVTSSAAFMRTKLS
jgi:hypothetical protein